MGAQWAARITCTGHTAEMKMVPVWYMNLSEREREVLLLIVSGLDLTDVAARLGISSSTASTYKCRVLEKVGVKNDVQLALLAVNAGLVTTTGRIHALLLPASVAGGIPIQGRARSAPGFMARTYGGGDAD